MKRHIVKIDEEKCNGCGICVNACAEGALQIVNGKAKLVSESYCDGLGACLPECPTGAITIEEREAAEFDEAAVKEHLAGKPTQGDQTQAAQGSQAHATQADQPQAVQASHIQAGSSCAGSGHGRMCPGVKARMIQPAKPVTADSPAHAVAATSQLRQWPCQLQLVPVNAPYLEGAHLLIAADCTAYAYANIHADFMRGKITLIACPKLDEYAYVEKLTEILKQHDIKSITVLRMEVPCCGGLTQIVKAALRNSDKLIPWHVTIISTDGQILEEC